ncbi:MAG: gidA [Anaerocolumna sp.]|jgi:thioredoxin reductase (NADPH)|nr:gidA [Anaerocolumna sp.]
MNSSYDIAIIGTGPAGLSAALNAKIRNKKFILFGNNKLSLKVEKAHLIQNYLGLPGVTGTELTESYKKHLTEMNIEITEKKVTNIFKMNETFSILANNEIYEAKSVIITTGVQTGRTFGGEENYLGRGVSYCATCDGALYKGKDIAVIAYNNEEEQEVKFLAGLASKVYYIPMYKNIGELPDNVEIVKSMPIEIKGEMTVKEVILKDNMLSVEGVFILRDTISPATLLPDLEFENNHINVDRLMKTNIAGCFAAGDVVGKPYQYIKAAGEGNIAALSAVGYLDK